jgi:hypothetical protein
MDTLHQNSTLSNFLWIILFQKLYNHIAKTVLFLLVFYAKGKLNKKEEKKSKQI